MIGFLEGLTVVGIAVIGAGVGVLTVFAAGHTIILLLWMRMHGVLLPAYITSVSDTGQFGKGGTWYALEAEFEWNGEARRIQTRSGYHIGGLFEKRRAQRILNKWRNRNVKILYCREIPKWLALRGSREIAFVKGLVYREVLFASEMLTACILVVCRLIIKI